MTWEVRMREKRSGVKKGMRSFLRESAELFCADTAVLHGTRGATVYGCHRILHYAPERICLGIGKQRISVRGKDLICTAFNAGCVTVEGRVDGISYCAGTCETCGEGEEE